MPPSVRKPSSLAFSLLFVSSSLGLGCGGPTVADIVESEVTLTVQGVASAPDVAAIGEPEAGLGVTRAVLRVSGVKLEPCRESVNELVLAPRAYELLDTPAPSESVSTAVQELCGLQVDIEPSSTSQVDGVPEAATLYVEGSDEKGEAFALTSDAVTSLRFETDQSASFGEQPLLLGIDVSTWLADLPRDEDVSEQLADQLKGAAALFVDGNGNGKLDDDEQTPIAPSAP